MVSINRYYKTKVNGEVNYLLTENPVDFPADNIDDLVNGNKNNVILSRYVGYSSSEDEDVYEIVCTGGVTFLTDYNGADDVLNRTLVEYAKYITEDGRRVSVNTDWDFWANPLHVSTIVQVKDGYNNTGDAEDDDNSVACYKVTMSNGDTFITNNDGTFNLDTNWC